MYLKPSRIALSAILLLTLSCIRGGAAERGWGSRSFGGVFSPKGVGLSASFQRPGGNFTSMSVNADLSDILAGNDLVSGVRGAVYFDIPMLEKDCNGLPCCIYAGPGLTAGYLHDKGSVDCGFMAGLSGAAGVRFGMWHHMVLAVEWQMDLAFILEGKSTVSFYKAGCMYSYYPHLRLQYEF